MAFGRGKVILLGEHGVVYGHPALATGIERGVTAKATAADADRLEVGTWKVSLAPDPGGEPLARAFAVALGLFGGSRPPLRVEARVDLPGGAGLGCSAALGVAVLGAIDEALGVERPREELARRAYEWERVFHGNPSGVDNTMAACGGIAIFRKGAPLEPVRAKRPLRLVIGYSGEPSSTKEMVESVARQRERDPVRVGKIFEGMAALVQSARLAVEAGDHRALGQLMDLNHALLSSLMLSTARLEEMCGAARASGAHGAKITGAGGGGCMIALVADEAAGARVEESLRGLATETFTAGAGA